MVINMSEFHLISKAFFLVSDRNVASVQRNPDKEKVQITRCISANQSITRKYEKLLIPFTNLVTAKETTLTFTVEQLQNFPGLYQLKDNLNVGTCLNLHGFFPTDVFTTSHLWCPAEVGGMDLPIAVLMGLIIKIVALNLMPAEQKLTSAQKDFPYFPLQSVVLLSAIESPIRLPLEKELLSLHCLQRNGPPSG